ncbi:MAG: hypothetical protein ACPL3Q_08040, partial [Candidatus Ratteibacteria bacterium]
PEEEIEALRELVKLQFNLSEEKKKFSRQILSPRDKSGETYRPERVFVSPTALPRFQEVAPAS